VYSLCRERAAPERNKHSTHHCSFRLQSVRNARRTSALTGVAPAAWESDPLTLSACRNRRPSRRAATRCSACGSYQPARCPDARMANAYPGVSLPLQLPGEGHHQSGRYRVNSSSRAAEPTGLLRYRSIPASRASSRPGCSLLAVSAISRRFCSRGR